MSSDNAVRRRGNPNWVAGGSHQGANRSGRPKRGASISEAVRNRFPIEDVLDRIASILDAPATNAREQCQLLTLVLAYGHGRPLSTVDLNVSSERTASLPVGWATMDTPARNAWIDDVRSRALRLGSGDDDDVIDVPDDDLGDDE